MLLNNFIILTKEILQNVKNITKKVEFEYFSFPTLRHHFDVFRKQKIKTLLSKMDTANLDYSSFERFELQSVHKFHEKKPASGVKLWFISFDNTQYFFEKLTGHHFQIMMFETFLGSISEIFRNFETIR